MLAIDGGEKVRNEPFPARHLFGKEERDAALALFDAAVKSGHAIGYNGAEDRLMSKHLPIFSRGLCRSSQFWNVGLHSRSCACPLQER